MKVITEFNQLNFSLDLVLFFPDESPPGLKHIRF